MSGHAYHSTLAETKRRQIIASAQDLFLREGYARATMADIAAAAAVSATTLYRHFPSKDVLFAGVVDASIERFAATLDAVALPGGDLRAGLGAFAHAYAELLIAPDTVAMTRLIMAEASHFPHIATRFLAAMKGPVFHRLADYLAAAISAGDLAPHDLGDSMGQFLGYLERSFLLPRLLDPAHTQPSDVRDHVARVAIDGLVATYNATPRASTPRKKASQ